MINRYVILLLLISCKPNSKNNSPINDVFDENLQVKRVVEIESFPSAPYSRVVLYYLNSIKYGSKNIEEMETAYMTAPYTNGLAFIDSLGR